jgi:hypothetical protein
MRHLRTLGEDLCGLILSPKRLTAAVRITQVTHIFLINLKARLLRTLAISRTDACPFSSHAAYKIVLQWLVDQVIDV